MANLSTLRRLILRRFSRSSVTAPDRRQTFRPRMEVLEDRSVPALLGNQLFPADHPWNQKISNAPIAGNSNAIMQNILSQYGDNHIVPDYSENWGTHRDLYGIPYNVVRGNSTPKVQVVIDDYADESDIVSVPLPSRVVLEGDYQDGPRAGLDNRGDSHLLLYDADNNIGYEFYRMSRPSENADGRWHAYQQTVWNFNTNTYRTLGWTSADAAGLSLLAGLARPDEGLPVSEGGQGAIHHAIRFTLQNRLVLNQFTYPASHTANPGNTNADLMPPMGTRFRLKADVDISTFQPQSRIIAQAMKDYGLILADNGSNFFFSGASESIDLNNNIFLTWNNDDIHDTNNGIRSLNYSDFEIVDLTPVVTGLSVTQGQAGDTVTLIGQNFSGSSGQLKVFFGSVSTTDVTYVDDSHLMVNVPSGAGTVFVRVQSGADVPFDSRNVEGNIFGYGISSVNTEASFTYSDSPTIEAPVFTSGTDINFQENRQGSFLISTTGNPTASLAIQETLPAGLSFVDNGNGTGYLQGKPTVGTRGTYGITVVASNGLATFQEITLTIKAAKSRIRAVGTEAGRTATVAVYGEDETRREIRPYGSGFKGGVRVAVADVNGDEIPDVITGPGPGMSPTVKVYSGDTLTLIASFNAYSSSYGGGVFVAAGKVLPTGTAQVVVGSGLWGNGVVKIFDLRSGVRLARTIQAFSSGAGVSVAASDGVLVAGRANGKQVKVYDQANLSRVRTITPFGLSAPGITVAVGGGWLACGKIAGDGEVRVFSLQSLQMERSFMTQATAFPKSGIGGTRLAWTESDPGQWELMVGSGSGWTATVEYWLPGEWNRREVKSEFASWQGGIWVA